MITIIQVNESDFDLTGDDAIDEFVDAAWEVLLKVAELGETAVIVDGEKLYHELIEANISTSDYSDELAELPTGTKVWALPMEFYSARTGCFHAESVQYV